MANITIFERDLTNAGASSVTDNVVYVPGYSTMGPIDEPILCNTLSEFQEIFGAIPYQFKTSNEHYNVNDFEKSYWYAAEILNSGLPVLFERVLTTDSPAYASSKIQLKVKSVASDIDTRQTEISNKSITLSKSGSQYTYTNATLSSETSGAYEIDANKPIVLDVTTRATADKGKIEISYSTDESGYIGTYSVNGTNEVELTDVSVTVNSVVFSINDIDLQEDATITYSLKNPVVYSVVSSLDGNNAIKWNIYYAIEESVDGKYTYAYKELTDGIISNIDLISKTYSVNIPKANYEVNNAKLSITDIETPLNNAEFIIKSKYPGEYGKNISFSISKSVASGIDYFDITTILNNGSASKPEINTISFIETDSKYYKNIPTNNIFELVANFDISKIPSELITLDEVKTTSLTYVSDIIDEFNVENFYGRLSPTAGKKSVFDKLTDRSEYQIKFITSGGYATYGEDFDAVIEMLTVAANRGDAVALIDHSINLNTIDTYNNLNNSLDPNSLNVKYVNSLGEDIKKYGAMFTPWAKYNLITAGEIGLYPASFAYLKCLAASSKNNANWFAISGITRGQVPALVEQYSKVTGAMAETVQARKGISINPITNIKPYGCCIWGNRTLTSNVDDLTASSFLNIRMLTNDVKKVVYKAAKELTFELNDNILWLNFKSKIEPTLDQMVSGNGLSGYKIVKVPTSKKAFVACKIILFAIEAVEDWEITVELADNYVSVQ